MRMEDNLRKYFPIIRSREEILAEIGEKEELKEQFYSWPRKRRRCSSWISW